MTIQSLKLPPIDNTQRVFPIVTDDFRIVGYKTKRTEDSFTYENKENIQPCSSLKMITQSQYLTYVKVSIDLDDLGEVIMYRQAFMSSHEVIEEMARFFKACNFKNRAQLVESLNNFEPHKLI